MADQENNHNEDLDNVEPMLDEDSFSLDLDDFDLGDDDLDTSPGMEPPLLDEIDAFDEEDSEISSMVASSEDDDDFLDIDLDSDLNLLGDEDPVLHDEDIHSDFSDIGDLNEGNEPSFGAPKPTASITNNSASIDDDLELEFDDDIIDLDKEIDAILNGEDGILTSKTKSNPLSSEDDDEGPIALSMDELANITGDLALEEEDHPGETQEPSDDFELSLDYNPSDIEEEEVLLPDETELESELGDLNFEPETQSETLEEGLITADSDLDLDLDESEVETDLSFDEEGKPELDLSEIGIEELPKEKSFTPLRDAEEEELFGNVKEDENLTLSDDELGNILGASGEISLEESLAAEDEFLASEEPAHFDDSESFDLLGEDDPIEEPKEDLSFDDFELGDKEEETDEGPITLSLDELENISSELVEENADDSNILDEEIEDESITLSPDELGNIIAGDPVEEEFGEETSGLEGELEVFEDSEDEGPIALSMEELESIATEAEEVSDEELVDSLDRAPLPYEENLTQNDDILSESEEDESIALSMEELENITGLNEEHVETVTSENLDEILGEDIPGEELEDIADLPYDEEAEVSGEFGSDIESLGESADLVEHEEDLDLNIPEITEPSVATTHVPTLQLDETAPIEIDLDEYAVAGKLSPLEELRNSDVKLPEANDLDSGELVNAKGEVLSSDDKKKVLGYLDNLLGNLPDEVIKEFSKSQYFELYKKMMKELEI